MPLLRPRLHAAQQGATVLFCTVPATDLESSMTGQADPKWLDEAIELARLSMTDVPDDPIDSCITAEDAVRAALPVIREGLAQEIEAQQPNAYNDGWYNGLALAAEIVRTEP
jgi:hypothetical protein